MKEKLYMDGNEEKLKALILKYDIKEERIIEIPQYWWEYKPVSILREGMMNSMKHKMNQIENPILRHILHPIMLAME